VQEQKKEPMKDALSFVCVGRETKKEEGVVVRRAGGPNQKSDNRAKGFWERTLSEKKKSPESLQKKGLRSGITMVRRKKKIPENI